MGRHSLATAVTQAGETRFEGSPDTVFEIGSITKAFTGVLLADMHLRGEVGLEDPLSRRWRAASCCPPVPTLPAPRWRSHSARPTESTAG